MKRKTSKYLSKKTTVDGISFDSKKEAERYKQLSLLEKQGIIKNLQLQVPFLLIPAQYEEVKTYTPKRHKEKVEKKLIERKIKYVADFVYTNENGKIVVEDVKGFRNSAAYAEYTIKRKLMLYIHGIKIVEI